MTRVEIADVILQEGERPSCVVVLLDRQNKRYLPITIGHAEGQSLVQSLHQTPLPRPLTYQFAASILKALGGELEEVRIEKLEDTIFYAVARIRRGEMAEELDSRPSDAINLAVLTDSPIYVAEEVFAKVNQDGAAAYIERARSAPPRP